jgi:hypothetical protein
MKALVICLLVLLGVMTYVAVHNSVPVCDDLVREQNAYTGDYDLVCEYTFGQSQEDSIQFHLRDGNTYRHVEASR